MTETKEDELRRLRGQASTHPDAAPWLARLLELEREEAVDEFARAEVYSAIIKECEDLEHRRAYTGNGHHLAQRLQGMVREAAARASAEGRLASRPWAAPPASGPPAGAGGPPGPGSRYASASDALDEVEALLEPHRLPGEEAVAADVLRRALGAGVEAVVVYCRPGTDDMGVARFESTEAARRFLDGEDPGEVSAENCKAILVSGRGLATEDHT